MTNNFDLYKQYITNGFQESVLEEGDTYYVIELIRRGKDHPNTPAANYHFKNYYIRQPSDIDKYCKEIISICDLLQLRAYASVNYKSFRQVTLNTIAELAHRVTYNDYNKSYCVFESCSGSYCNSKDKRWVIDIDDEKIDGVVVENIKDIINERCAPLNTNKITAVFPTKSGVHLITKSFDRMEFSNCTRYIGTPSIQKNHLTLLYENIGTRGL